MFWSYYGIMLYFVQIYFAGFAVLVEKYYAGSFILK